MSPWVKMLIVFVGVALCFGVIYWLVNLPKSTEPEIARRIKT